MTRDKISSEDVELLNLIADVLDQWTESRSSYQPAGFYPSDRDNAAVAVLAALAGRLLPPVVGEKAEYAWRYQKRDLEWTNPVLVHDLDSALEDCGKLRRMGAVAQVLVRTVRFLAGDGLPVDGGEWVGPWLPVEEGT